MLYNRALGLGEGMRRTLKLALQKVVLGKSQWRELCGVPGHSQLPERTRCTGEVANATVQTILASCHTAGLRS